MTTSRSHWREQHCFRLSTSTLTAVDHSLTSAVANNDLDDIPFVGIAECFVREPGQFIDQTSHSPHRGSGAASLTHSDGPQHAAQMPSPGKPFVKLASSDWHLSQRPHDVLHWQLQMQRVSGGRERVLAESNGLPLCTTDVRPLNRPRGSGTTSANSPDTV